MARVLLIASDAGGVIHGAVLGLSQLATDVAAGVCGVVAEPVKGFKEDGAAGAAKGLLRGAAGAVSRPVAGALDVVGGVGTGVSNRLVGLAKRELLPADRDLLARLSGTSPSTGVIWMWGDTSKLARKNPARWSSPKSAAETIKELERYREQQRPVLLAIPDQPHHTSTDVSAAILLLREMTSQRLEESQAVVHSTKHPTGTYSAGQFQDLATVTLLMILSEETAMRLVLVVSSSCRFLRITALSNAIWCGHFRHLNAQVGWLTDDELVSNSDDAIAAYYEQQPEEQHGREVSPFQRVSYCMMYKVLYLRATECYRDPQPSAPQLVTTGDHRRYQLLP